MFKGLQETIRNLNADLNNVSNCKKAKRLRRNLLLIGISLIIFALVGAVFCLIIFATEGFENLKNASKDINDFKIETILIPFIALIPIIIAGMIGVALTRLGFQIIIIALIVVTKLKKKRNFVQIVVSNYLKYVINANIKIMLRIISVTVAEPN